MINIKNLIVKEIVHHLDGVNSGVLIDYQGITAEEVNDLRNELREKNVQMKVFKNTLFEIALKELDLGVEFSKDVERKDIYEKPTAVLFSEEYPSPVEPAKAFDEWRKANKKDQLEIKGGFYGKKMISASEVKQYIDLPNRETLLAQAVGGMAAPLTSFMGVCNAAMRDLVLVLTAVKDKQEE